jgi:glycosyl hydrolase family 106( putative alpha-L-rhamnosidase)
MTRLERGTPPNAGPRHHPKVNSNAIYTRRQFLRKSGTAGMAYAAGLVGQNSARANGQKPPSSPDSEIRPLRDVFLHPPDSARPMTRWWWFGGAVTPEEITRELTLMREAGLRGVELQPVYPVEVDDPKRGIHNIRYFSPEWFELLRHTVKETRRLGMQFDSTLGSGWPYGGPFIPVELAARKLQVLTQDVVGPRDFSWDFHPLLPDQGKIVATLAVPTLPSAELDIEHSLVVSSLRGGRWQVPAGHWKIMIFVDAPTLMQVKRPTLGMEGYVLDHFSHQALDLFLSAVGDRTLEELKDLGPRPFHSVFCDSLEVEGADWTPNFLKEFRDRRGYDLTPYLPALWMEAGPLAPHVRYDYHRTLSELLLDNFFRRLAEWSESRGMTARVQAHGAMGDVMQAYGLAHIPEGEHYGRGDRYLVDIAHRRLASSAGHIYQKPVISAETYTWLRAPRFMVTLEMMKAATDAQFLEGINQIVNHGYPYSPPQAGQPGWTFYASTMINHNNIWWRHYVHLARYIQRVSGLLQHGVSVNAVAVYLPLADLYSKLGAGGVHVDEEMERHLGAGLVLGLRQAGYDFDFIHDDALQRIAKVENGRLVAGTGIYSVLIVPKAQLIPPESLDRLVEFAQSGGFLMFVKQIPDLPPGLSDRDSRTRRVRAALNNLWANTPQRQGEVFSSGKGKIYRAQDISDALAHLKQEITPDFHIIQAGDNSDAARKLATENVGFVHRGSGSSHIYFVSNVSEHWQDLRVQFAVGRRVPQRWNPETGAVEETLVYQYIELPHREGSATVVQLRLEPFESCFVAFSSLGYKPSVTRTNWPGPLKIETVGKQIQATGVLPQKGNYFLADAEEKIHRFSVTDLPDTLPIRGPWRLTLGDRPSLSLERFVSWAELAEGKNYSGWGTYETDFEMIDLGRETDWILDLGTVHETAEVTLNGVPLGAAWKGLRRLSCREALKAGTNHLKIEVGNLWINRVRSLPKPDLKPVATTFGIRWGGQEEDNLPVQIPPAGLLGPVQLVPLKRRTERF